MKKIIVVLFAVSVITACMATAQPNPTLQPDLALLKTWESAERPSAEHSQPYIAVFKKDGKTLVYLASEHNSGKTYFLQL